MISTFGIIAIVAVFVIEIILNYCVPQKTNAKCMKISHSLLFLGIRFKFSIMFNGVNLQRGSAFTLVFAMHIAFEILEIYYRTALAIST